LIGGATGQQMCDELKAGLHLRSMDKPLPVEGVGKSAQVADQAACIPMAVLDVFGKKSDATYTVYCTDYPRQHASTTSWKSHPSKDASDHGLRKWQAYSSWPRRC